MNDEKTSELPSGKSRLRWRMALLHFFFFGSWTIAWEALSKLHSAGRPVMWIVISGVLQGVTFAALMYLFQRRK